MGRHLQKVNNMSGPAKDRTIKYIELNDKVSEVAPNFFHLLFYILIILLCSFVSRIFWWKIKW